MTVHAFSSLGKTTDRKLNQLVDTSHEKFEILKKKSVGDLYRDTKEWMQQNPGKTLAGAAVTGVVVGWYLRRRR